MIPQPSAEHQLKLQDNKHGQEHQSIEKFGVPAGVFLSAKEYKGSCS